MKIPKQILHPLIIGFASVGLLYLLWLSTPSAATQNKKEILSQNGMHQIEDVLPGGLVLFTDTPGQWQLEHDRFKKMDIQQAEKLKDFFIGKFIKIANIDGAKDIVLPLELYSPFCFSGTDSVEAQTQCPVVLQP